VRRALRRQQDALERLATVGEHDHQPAAEITRDAAEHRTREERRLGDERIDERPEAVAGERVALRRAAGYRNISSIRSEYFWLTNLRFTLSEGVSSPVSWLKSCGMIR
jgi:hypothetical protein